MGISIKYSIKKKNIKVKPTLIGSPKAIGKPPKPWDQFKPNLKQSIIG